jgi:hypothetical protein
VNPKIWGVDFVANLIVLESKGIDVILGMERLSKHNVLINCTEKSIKLATPEGKEMEFVTKPVVTANGVANHAKVNQLDASQGSKGPVVNEFPDVFPEELPGMPPDRDITTEKRHSFISFFIFVGSDVDISNYVHRLLNYVRRFLNRPCCTTPDLGPARPRPTHPGPTGATVLHSAPRLYLVMIKALCVR